MGEFIDPTTGEVMPIEMVPLNLAALDESEILQAMPSPVQVAGGLMKSRGALTRAPRALAEARSAVDDARKAYRIALGVETMSLLDAFPKAGVEERRTMAHAAPEVIEAASALAIAEEAYQHARDWNQALGRDVEVLRSLNANMRRELP